MFLIVRFLVQGLLVGVQQGAGVATGSAAAIALNTLVYAISLAFAGLVIFTHPHRSTRVHAVMVAVAVAEASVSFCIMLLCILDSADVGEATGLQTATFALQIVAVALTMVFTWVTSGALVSASLVLATPHHPSASPHRNTQIPA